jgi:hypothetical protein
MGIPCLRDVNISLLASWLKRYLNGEGKLWKCVVDKNTILATLISLLALNWVLLVFGRVSFGQLCWKIG